MISRFNIAIDALSLPDQIVGAGYYLYRLIEYIAKTNTPHRYFIFIKTGKKEVFEKIVDERFKLIEFDFKTLLQRAIFEQFKFNRIIKKHGINVLHGPHYTIPFFADCKKIVTFHDMTYFSMPQAHVSWKVPYFQNLMKWSACHSNALISVSESTKSDMCKLFRIPENKITVTPLGLDPVFYPRMPEEYRNILKKYNIQEQFVLFVGTLEPRKNLIRLIEAYNILRRERQFKIPLVVVGKKGWMFDDIFNRVKKYSLEKNIVFTDYVPEEDLPMLMSAARVFIYPSLYEGFGLPPLEAMACGTPVITSNISSMPEVVADAGILIDPADINNIADAIAKLNSDDTLIEKYSKKGIDRASRFSWKRLAEKTVSLYEKIAGFDDKGINNIP